MTRWFRRQQGEGQDSPLSHEPHATRANTDVYGQQTVHVHQETLHVRTTMYRGYPTHVGKDGRMLDWEELSPHQLALAACSSNIKARVVQEWIAEQQLEAAIEPGTSDYEALQTTKLVLADLVALEQPESGR